MPSYQELVIEAQALCALIADNPQARLATRQAFYQRYGFSSQDGFSYGDSELAFLKWEIRRGVLNPMSANPAGSHWWRNVNLDFIFHSELAGLMDQQDVSPTAETPAATLAWLNFLAHPTPTNWYRAHNTTILAGFEAKQAYMADEIALEREFINITLYRLLFAQALVEDATIFGNIGKWIADPRGFAVDFIVHLTNFYPNHYPLTEADRPLIEGTGHSIQALEVKILDRDIILPHLSKLYQAAAQWNNSPFLLTYEQDGVPVYPPSLP